MFSGFLLVCKVLFCHLLKKKCDEDFELSRLADGMLRLVGRGVFLAVSRNIYFNSNNVGRLPGYLRKLLLSLLLFFCHVLHAGLYSIPYPINPHHSPQLFL